MSPHRYLKLAFPTAAILGVGGAIAIAAIPAADGTINGCYDTSARSPNGQLRIVDDPSQCLTGTEKAIHWNQQGPQGPAGPQGQKGDQGAAATTPTPTPVAQTFLKFTGIPGSSTAPGHVGDIEVRSFSWGLETTGGTGSGGGGGVGKAKFQDLHFSKGHDKASAELYRAAGTGQHFAKATFSVIENGQEKIRYKLIDVTVRSFQTTDGFFAETENVALAPHQVQLIFNDHGTQITQIFAVSHHGKAVVKSLSLKSRIR